MKKILSYLLAGLLVGGMSCTKDDAAPAGEGTVSFRIEMDGQTRAEYNPLDDLLIRIYKADGGLIRRYTALADMPENLYLVAGSYRITVDAGDKSAATWTNKTYRGEKEFTVRANQAITEQVTCLAVNTGARVAFDATIAAKLDVEAYAYVSASNQFQMSEINEVPSLRYDLTTPDGATGYFILPEGVTNLSWGFYGEGSELGKVKQTGVIENVQPATVYKLKFQYSKTPDGSLSLTVLVEEAPEEHFDNIIFSPQPTIAGDGFRMGETIGYHQDEVRFNVSSVKRLRTVRMTVNGSSFEIYDAAVPAAPQEGVSYTKIDDNNLVVTLGSTFFANYATGLHDLAFDMTDADGGTGTGSTKFAIPGMLEIGASDYDLWTNTAVFRAIVTDPAATDVKFSYRTAEGEWKEIAAAKGADCIYSATAAPGWTTGTNAAHTTYVLDKATGIFANETYEYKLAVGGTETASKTFTTTVDQPIPDGGLENGSLSCFTTDNGAASFWASGNNSFAKGLCTQSTYTGMEGAYCAKLTAAAPVGILAAGNLLTGYFYKDGLTTGVVEFGQPYAWKARPTAMRVKYYAEKIGTVDVSKHSGAPIGSGDQDVARIFVAIVDWNSRHKVTSGTSAPTGTWDPTDGPNAVSEGRIIAYGSMFIDASSSGGQMIDTVLPLDFYDRTAKPAGPYTLVISCSTSAYGDFMVGCQSNVLYVDDFEWIF